MMERVRNYAYLMRLDKPIGTLLLLWPTLCALLLASEASVDMKTIWLFCLGAFFARSMGCVINDFFDKDIDSGVIVSDGDCVDGVFECMPGEER